MNLYSISWLLYFLKKMCNQWCTCLSLHRTGARVVYVKGVEKIKWLERFIHNVQNLEDFNCPPVEKLEKKTKIYIKHWETNIDWLINENIWFSKFNRYQIFTTNIPTVNVWFGYKSFSSITTIPFSYKFEINIYSYIFHSVRVKSIIRQFE